MIEPKHFENLIIIQSLETMIAKHLELIKNHQSRITKIENMRKEKEEEQEKLTKELNDLQRSISSQEAQVDNVITQLQQSENNSKFVTSESQANAIEKEISQISIHKDQLESTLMEQLEKQENLELQLKDTTDFLTGSSLSLSDVSQEVKTDIEKEELEIVNLKERIQQLFSICSSEATIAYHETSKRLPTSPLAFIKGGNCTKCFFAIERNLESQVERATIIEYCPGCGRILAPNLTVCTN